MSDLNTAPISEVIAELRRVPDRSTDDPLRAMIGQLVFSTLANRLEEQQRTILQLADLCVELGYRARQHPDDTKKMIDEISCRALAEDE